MREDISKNETIKDVKNSEEATKDVVPDDELYESSSESDEETEEHREAGGHAQQQLLAGALHQRQCGVTGGSHGRHQTWHGVTLSSSQTLLISLFVSDMCQTM